MPTLVGTSTSAPSASSQGTTQPFVTQQTPAQAGAAAGDLLIAIGGHERTTQPTLGGIAGFTLGRAEEGTESAVVIGWKRLVAGDLGSAVTMTTAGATRRGALAFLVLREAGDPLFTNGTVAGGANAQTTAPHPSATPATANATLLSLMLAVSNVTPYARTFTSAAGWTEDVETGSASTTAVNAFVYAAHTTGGAAGTAVTGNVVTADVEKFRYLPTTVVVPHAPSTAPLTVSGGGDRTVAAGETVRITVSSTGGVAPVGLDLRHTLGPVPASGFSRSGNVWTFVAPRIREGTTLGFRATATDATPTTATVTFLTTVQGDPDVPPAGGGGTPARPAAPDGWDEFRLLGPSQAGAGNGGGATTPPADTTAPPQPAGLGTAPLGTSPLGG